MSDLNKTFKMPAAFIEAVKTIGFEIGPLETPELPKKPFVELKFNKGPGFGPVPVGLEIELTAQYGPDVYEPKAASDGKDKAGSGSDDKPKDKPKNPRIHFLATSNPELSAISDLVGEVLSEQLEKTYSARHTDTPKGYTIESVSVESICKAPDANKSSKKTIAAGNRLSCNLTPYTKCFIIEEGKARKATVGDIQEIHKTFGIGRYFASINLGRLSYFNTDIPVPKSKTDKQRYPTYTFSPSIQTLYFVVEETAKIAESKSGGTGLLSKYGVSSETESVKRKTPEPTNDASGANGANNVSEESGEPPAKKAKVSPEIAPAPEPVPVKGQDETEEDANEDVASD